MADKYDAMTPTEKALREALKKAIDALEQEHDHGDQDFGGAHGAIICPDCPANEALLAELRAALALPPAVAEEAGKPENEVVEWLSRRAKISPCDGTFVWLIVIPGMGYGLFEESLKAAMNGKPPAPVADAAPENVCDCGEKREHYHDRNDSRVFTPAPVSLTEEEREALREIERCAGLCESASSRHGEVLARCVRRLTEKP